VKRIFLALDITEEIKQAIQPQFWYWRDELFKDWPIKWVDPVQWHITLVFLGDKTDEEIEIVEEVVRAHEFLPSAGEVRGWDYFGRGSDVRVIYINYVNPV